MACHAGVSEERRGILCVSIGRVPWVHDLALVCSESRAAQRRAERPMHDAINLSCYYYCSATQAEQLVELALGW